MDMSDKLDEMKDDIGEVKGDIKRILTKMPGDESLQTQSQCERHRKSVDRVIAALATLDIAILGWLFYLSTH